MDFETNLLFAQEHVTSKVLAEVFETFLFGLEDEAVKMGKANFKELLAPQIHSKWVRDTIERTSSLFESCSSLRSSTEVRVSLMLSKWH
jgi:hypothetical protein